MKKLTLLSVITILIASVTTISCRKSQRDNDSETQSVADNALAGFVYNDVFKQIYFAYVPDTTLPSLTCDTSFFSPAFPDTTYPKTLTIRFDTVNGCLGSDGILRKGIITAVLTGDLGDSLSMATITFNKYYVNGNKITGTKTIINKGRNATGKTVFNTKVSGGNIVRPDGEQISWASNLNREWTQGDTTSISSDDLYSITGTANGTGISGSTFTVTINSALQVALSCQYPLSGTLTLQPGNLLPRKVDFGSGGCDMNANVAFGGKKYDITLP